MDALRRMAGVVPAAITEQKLRKAQAELKKKGNYIESAKTRVPALNQAEKDRLTLNYVKTQRNINELEKQLQSNLSNALVNKRKKMEATHQEKTTAAFLPKKSLTNSIVGRTTATAARKRNYNCTCTQKKQQGGKRRYKRRLTRRKSRRN